MNTLPEINSAFIPNKDLVKWRTMPGDYDFGLMAELKLKGAPVIGTFMPRPDFDNYNWEMSYVMKEEPTSPGSSLAYVIPGIEVKWRAIPKSELAIATNNLGAAIIEALRIEDIVRALARFLNRFTRKT